MKRNKERRQIEIIALIQQSEETISIPDLCSKFDVETATINRDLNELRERGVIIHSIKKRLHIAGELTEKKLESLLTIYFNNAGKAISFPKNTALVIKNLKRNTLDIFVKLVNAIESRSKLEIDYYKASDNIVATRQIEPIIIFPTNRDWRLIARSDDIYKQRFIHNIRRIKVLDEKFRRERDFNAGDIFRRSFEYWSGEDLFEVVVKFDHSVAHIINNSVFGEEQKLEKNKDGTVSLKMTVNNLDEVANWLMSWGGNAKVIKPAKLRSQLKKKAKDILQNY